MLCGRGAETGGELNEKGAEMKKNRATIVPEANSLEAKNDQ